MQILFSFIIMQIKSLLSNDLMFYVGRVKIQADNLLESLVLTDSERNHFVNEHNRRRRLQSGATNMRLMVWDEELAAFASNYVQ